MKSCCEKDPIDFDKLQKSQSRALKIVLAINAMMFFVEFGAGVVAGSTALMADSIDMLGDALVYALSLFVLTKAEIWKTRSAFFKGSLMLLLGLGILIEAVIKSVSDVSPQGELISGMAIVVLIANSLCLFVLAKHRTDDINMESAWICSRNDVASNIGVLAAGTMVYFLQSKWPDIVVGALISFLVIVSSWKVLKKSWRKLESNH